MINFTLGMKIVDKCCVSLRFMIRKKKYIVAFSLLIIFSLLLNAIPVHKIFHKHSFTKDTSSAQVVLKKFDKPCCDVDFGIITADQPYAVTSLKTTISYASLVFTILVGQSNNLTFSLQNKAPPVAA